MPAPLLPDWLARQLPFERYLVSVEGHRLHVMETGRGRPVVMLHGNPTWGYLYRKVAAALAGEPLRIIMPDLLGLGLSDKPRDASLHTLEDHARLFGGLLDALALDPFVLVCHDWGGPISMCAVAERPEKLAGLVVLNTALSPPMRASRSTPFHRFARVPVVSDVVFRGLGFPQAFLGWAQGDRVSIGGEVRRAYRWPLRRFRDNLAPLALARMVPDSPDHPSVPALRRCHAFVSGWRGPRALVWGDRDPILRNVRPWIERLLKGAKVTRTEAGHFLQEEVPEAIADAVRHAIL